MIRKVKNLETKVDVTSEKADRIAKAIDEFQQQSYQYNLKLVGIRQIRESETANDTIGLWLKIFSGIGADITAWDIDTAHRVTNARPIWSPKASSTARRSPNNSLQVYSAHRPRSRALKAQGN